MIKTKQMAAREISTDPTSSDLPYVNSNNELVGTCSALEMFFCPHGLTQDATHYRIASPVGDAVFIDLIANLLASTTASFSVASGAGALNTGFTPFTIGTNDDFMLIVAGQPITGSTSFLRFGLTGTTTCTIAAGTNSTNSAVNIVDDAATSVSIGTVGASTNDITYTCITACDVSSATGGVRTRMGGSSGDTLASIATGTPGNISALTTFAIDADTVAALRGKIFAAGLFIFPSNTLPSNHLALAKWMGNQWAAGNYVFPRGW